MIKEELESKFEDCFDANTRASEGGYGPDVTDRLGMWWAFEPIVSEFAKQQAIAFSDWLITEGFYPYEKEIGRWRNISDGILTWPTQELHNRFIEQQTKDK